MNAQPIAVSPEPVRSLVHAGLRVELTAGRRGRPLRFGERVARSLAATTEAPTLATVHLALFEQLAAVVHDPEAPMLEIDWDAREGVARGTGGLLRFREVITGTFAASYHYDGTRSSDSILRSLRDSLVPLAGGVFVHASAVRVSTEAGDVAVLFTGRSGAGKSTAARQSEAPLFAADRVALYARSGRVWAWRLPQGSEASGFVREGEPTVLPVAAVLDVRQSSASRIAPLGASEALLALRASVQSPRGADESGVLARCDEITRHCFVGSVQTVLGEKVRLEHVLTGARLGE